MQFDEQAEERLIELLDAKSEIGSTMRTDEAQAFMLAILSGPDTLAVADWLPDLLGDETLYTEQEREEVGELAIQFGSLDALNGLIERLRR